MTSKAINSGAINAVSFPGSESGATLIELIGDVEVSGSISVTYLRVGATGSTRALATTGRPTPKTIALLGATTGAEAVPSASALRKISVGAASVEVRCSALSGASFRYGASAATQAYAAVRTSDTLRKSVSSASVAATATSSCGAIKRCSFSAISAALASSSVNAKSKIPLSAISRAPASASASIIILVSASARSTASAIGLVGALLYGRRGAATTASASWSLSVAKMRLGVSALARAVADPLSPSARIRISGQAYVSATAVTGASSLRYRQAAGSTSARADYYCLARDFASSVRAPDDRQMMVPENDRTMKVEPA